MTWAILSRKYFHQCKWFIGDTQTHTQWIIWSSYFFLNLFLFFIFYFYFFFNTGCFHKWRAKSIFWGEIYFGKVCREFFATFSRFFRHFQDAFNICVTFSCIFLTRASRIKNTIILFLNFIYKIIWIPLLIERRCFSFLTSYIFIWTKVCDVSNTFWQFIIWSVSISYLLPIFIYI